LSYYTEGFQNSPVAANYHALNAGDSAYLWNVTPLSATGDSNNIGYDPMVIAGNGTPVVPEPASLTLWALLGLAGVGCLRRPRAKV
jgi:hypothetical protein